MRRLLSCLVLSLGLASGAASADSTRLYFGAGVSDGTVDITGGSSKSLGTLTATLGFQLHDFVGVELGFGSASDEASSVLNDPLVSYQAVLLRLGYRWDRLGVYLLGGQARLDIDDQFNSSDAGNAMGLGINLFGNETTSLNFHVLDFDDGAFTTATIGFQHYFGGFR